MKAGQPTGRVGKGMPDPFGGMLGDGRLKKEQRDRREWRRQERGAV